MFTNNTSKTMKKFTNTFVFLILSIFISNNIFAYSDGTPLEHFACKSNSASFSISPNGKYMLIQNTRRDNNCDIEQDYSKYAEDETYDRGLILMNLDTKETTMLSSGKERQEN